MSIFSVIYLFWTNQVIIIVIITIIISFCLPFSFLVLQPFIIPLVIAVDILEHNL